MSSSRTSKFHHLVRTCAVGALALAAVGLATNFALADTARQRGTFTISPSTVLGLTGLATGVVDDENPLNTKVSVSLGTQSAVLGSMQASYTGNVTADISFDTVTKAITGIHIVNANAVAGNSGNWQPGNWDPNKYAPNGKDWDPGETVPQGMLGGFPNNGADLEPSNYGGSILGNIIYFAARDFSLNIRNAGATFAVAPGGNFTATQAQKGQFLTGHTGIYSPLAPDDIESNDPVTDYRDAEIDSLAVQPATFTYTDAMGQHTGNNPQAGLAYPSGLVWRYVESKVSQPVYDINHNPVYNTPGDPMSGQKTIELRTYTQGAAGLAPAFEVTKGGLNTNYNQTDPPFDKDWYDPSDGNVGSPDAVRLFVDSTTDFDINGNPLKIRPQLQLPNAGIVYSDADKTVPVSSNIGSTLNGPNDYTLNLAMNVDMTAAFFIGDFAVSLEIGMARNFLLLNKYVPGTGRLLADGDFSLRPGDVNNDGFVDIFDINMVSSNWSPSPSSPSDPYAGDANGDGFVDIFDINLISSNWAPPGASTAVPEPSSLLMAAVGAIALALACRRRK